MVHDFNKPPHVTSAEEIRQKKTLTSVHAYLSRYLFLSTCGVHALKRNAKLGMCNGDCP